MSPPRKVSKTVPGPHWKAGETGVNIGEWFSQEPVFTEKCTYCLLCWLYCPDGAIRREDSKKLLTVEPFCKNCGICVEVCPVKAVVMVPKAEKKGKS